MVCDEGSSFPCYVSLSFPYLHCFLKVRSLWYSSRKSFFQSFFLFQVCRFERLSEILQFFSDFPDFPLPEVRLLQITIFPFLGYFKQLLAHIIDRTRLRFQFPCSRANQCAIQKAADLKVKIDLFFSSTTFDRMILCLSSLVGILH